MRFRDRLPIMTRESENQFVSRPREGAGVLVFATLVLCTSFGEVATGLIVPAMPALGDVFQRSPVTIQLTIVSFAVMFASGQLFFGPFSDRRGRRTALLIGAVLTLAGSAIAAMADSIWVIVLGRAIQGLGGASGYVVSRAIVRDIYGADGAPKAMAALFALMAASFLAAPLVGGALIDVASWRAGFVFAGAAALIWLVSTLFVLPETGTVAPASEAQKVHIVYLGLFRHKGFLAFMLTHSIGYAGLYCFVAGGPYYFIESLGTMPSVYGVIAALAMSGFLTGSFAARSAIPRWGSAKVIHVSLALMFFPPLVLTGLALAGWLPVALIVALQFVFWFGGGFLAPNTAAGVMMSHPKAAGAAAAVLGFVQMCAAAAVSLAQGLIYDGTLYPVIGMQVVLGLAAWLIWKRLRRYTP
tara:strand:+ start:1069 stop:2310 length:1242 start_codon:yes stop_codon:yes gene_type:complete